VTIRYALPGSQQFHADWMQTNASVARSFPVTPREGALDGRRNESIRFENVSFCHEGASRPALESVTFELRHGESVGLVGRSGSGKSTLAEMLLGLYRPTSGRITVGGVVLEGKTLQAWRMCVGYVPQHVFLSAASVAENIAFGLPTSEIDRAAVERAAEQAQAADFVASLPEGLDTMVGERGVRLSGGQRQRLGIARSLYHQPSVLVFDEATSALDGLTEDAVMDAVRVLSASRTVVLIAHRLRTVEACSRILMLDAGRLVADGEYVGLRKASRPFRVLLGLDAASEIPEATWRS
jgi:ABC-type bacteriocin/lantibiotic exporter with double-glycine peptidase domain